MNDKKMFERFKALTEIAEFSCLTTINEKGYPETRAMLNLRNPGMFPNLKEFFKNNFTCFFSSNTSSRKLKHISKADKSSVYYVNPQTFEGLLLKGKIEVIKDKRLKKDFWQNNWSMYYNGGVNDPDYTLLKFTSQEYNYYNGNLEVKSGTF